MPIFKYFAFSVIVLASCGWPQSTKEDLRTAEYGAEKKEGLSLGEETSCPEAICGSSRACCGRAESIPHDPLGALENINPLQARLASVLGESLETGNGIRATDMQKLVSEGIILESTASIPRQVADLAWNVCRFGVANPVSCNLQRFRQVQASSALRELQPVSNYYPDVFIPTDSHNYLSSTDSRIGPEHFPVTRWNSRGLPTTMRAVIERVYYLDIGRSGLSVVFAGNPGGGRGEYQFFPIGTFTFDPGDSESQIPGWIQGVVYDTFQPIVTSEQTAINQAIQNRNTILIGLIPIVGGVYQIAHEDILGGGLSLAGDIASFGMCSKLRMVRLAATCGTVGVNSVRISNNVWSFVDGNGSVMGVADTTLAAAELVAAIFLARHHLPAVEATHKTSLNKFDSFSVSGPSATGRADFDGFLSVTSRSQCPEMCMPSNLAWAGQRRMDLTDEQIGAVAERVAANTGDDIHTVFNRIKSQGYQPEDWFHIFPGRTRTLYRGVWAKCLADVKLRHPTGGDHYLTLSRERAITHAQGSPRQPGDKLFIIESSGYYPGEFALHSNFDPDYLMLEHMPEDWLLDGCVDLRNANIYEYTGQ